MSVEGKNELQGASIFGAALFDIGWRLAAGILLPLWLISKYKSSWLNSSWLALIVVWIAFVFVSVVYFQLKKLPKEYGGL